MGLRGKESLIKYIPEASIAPDPKDLQRFILDLQQIRFKAQEENNPVLDVVARGFQNYAARKLISLSSSGQKRFPDKKF